jgi:cold shock CspA family protein
VKTLQFDKGFGFVSCPERGKADLFFHVYDLQESESLWNENLIGQQLQFDVELTQKGPRAVCVRLAAQPTAGSFNDSSAGYKVHQ